MPHVPATVQLLRPRDDASVMLARRGRTARLDAQLEARPMAAGRRSLPQTLDLALEVLRLRFARMLLLGALAWIPVRALQPFVGQHNFARAGIEPLFGQSLGSLASLAATALAQALGAALLARLVHEDLEGRELSPWVALRFVFARLPAVLGIALVTAAASVAGLCACIVPWFLVAWKLSLAPFVCVIEDRGVFDSLRRSFQLTQRGFWRWALLAGASLLIALPFSGITALSDYPEARARALGWSGLSSGTYDLVLVLATSLLQGLATALHAAAFTIYYADARVRREGSDLGRELATLRRGERA